MAPQLNSKAGPAEPIADRRAVDAAEDIELVVVQVDRDRIVGLIRRTLRLKPTRSEDAEQAEGQFGGIEKAFMKIHWNER